ncbi:MAG: hypothetical protein ABJA37_11115 [Ferruginibacter sp.]
MNKGITILPELAIAELTRGEKKQVRHFKAPAPARGISIVTYYHFVKQRIIDVLKEEIVNALPAEMLSLKRKLITEI